MLGEALRLFRVFHDCKTSELAKALEISAGYISDIENNKKTPSLDTLRKYADYFDTTVSSILYFSEDLDKEKPRQGRAAIRKKLIKFMQFVENATA